MLTERRAYIEDAFKTFLVDFVGDVIFDYTEEGDVEGSILKSVEEKVKDGFLPTISDRILDGVYNILNEDEGEDIREEYEIGESIYNFVYDCVVRVLEADEIELDDDFVSWIVYRVGSSLEEDLEVYILDSLKDEYGLTDEDLEGELDEAKIPAFVMRAGKKIKKMVDPVKRTKRLSAKAKRAIRRATRRKKPGAVRKWKKSMKRRGSMISKGMKKKAQKILRRKREKSRDIHGAMRKVGKAKEGVELAVFMVAESSFTLKDIYDNMVDIEEGFLLEVYDNDKDSVIVEIHSDEGIVKEEVIFKSVNVGRLIEQGLLETINADGYSFSDMVVEGINEDYKVSDLLV